MATKTDTTRLDITARESSSSRETRRLRRTGRVPGVLYGRDLEPLSFSVDARELRHALAGAGAVLELSLGEETTSAVLKDSQRHPVRGEIMHVDMLRVDLNKPIAAAVTVEVVGGDESPGVKDGGIIDQVTREVNIEALPSDIPESIQFDASELNIGDTILLSALVAPAGVTITDDLEENVLISVAAPRLAEEADELETETELVGEDGEPVEPSEDGGGDEPAAEGDDSGSND